MLTYDNWDQVKAAEIFDHRADFLDVLKWAFQEYGEEIVYACSFGAEGIVLIDLINKIKKNAKIIFLDTGLHFPETYETIEKVRNRYPSLQIEHIKPNITLDQQEKWYGEDLWEFNPNLCCHMRKVAPLKEALRDVKAWISGLRRDQTAERANTKFINKDEKFQRIKICPLIHWSWDDIWAYIQLNHLPYNSLHDNGYPSIGCAVCTQPVVGKSGSLREGRWAGINKTECGLHVK
ncbi:phosphoadenylyl-sulfate reductase [Bacillus sp. BRMEA1]|nr:phosphoadenylyl-sulfate reductase [Neobacillus endophyticus]